jgi:hypothetical protein
LSDVLELLRRTMLEYRGKDSADRKSPFRCGLRKVRYQGGTKFAKDKRQIGKISEICISKKNLLKKLLTEISILCKVVLVPKRKFSLVTDFEHTGFGSGLE